LGVGKSYFYDSLVHHSDADPYVPGTPGVLRLKLLHLAPNAVAAFDDEVDALVEGLRAWRDAGHPKPSTVSKITVSKKAKQASAETAHS
jgi:hypothetical protein